MEVQLFNSSCNLPVMNGNEFQRRLAVSVEDCWLGYFGVGNVLRGVNMTVHQSAIYGLLGPSGCGKTTLIKCIAGLSIQGKGTITLFGYPSRSKLIQIPGRDLGYMPQEGTLYEQLTVIETLLFFARINLVDMIVVKKSVDNLIKVLDLPEDDRAVSTLSGGQKRRLQFATALIHNPRLLILDEPTAGADPIVRAKIWEYLKCLSKARKTAIIITTHYIEEARQADKIGLMREGQIMEEAEPNALLAQHSLSTLEEVFLKICNTKNQPKQIEYNEERETKIYAPKFGSTSAGLSDLFKCNIFDWMKVVFTIAWKTNLLNLRTPLFLFFQYILPTFPVFLMGWCIGGDPRGIKLGVVNEEFPTNYSAIFLKRLDPVTMIQIPYSNMNDAWLDARATKIWGILSIKQNFSEHLSNRVKFDNDLDIAWIDKSIIKLHADLSDKLTSVYIERSLENSFLEFIQDVAEASGHKKGLVSLPIQAVDPIYAARNLKRRDSYREYVYPGAMIVSCFSISFGITSYVVTSERNELMLERYHAAAISSLMFLCAHAVTRLLTAIIQSSIVILAIVYLFDVFIQPSLINLFGVLLLLFFQALTGMTLGMVIGTTFSSIPSIASTCFGVMMYVLFVSGIIWPIEAMPIWLRWYCYMQPTTYPVITLRNVLTRRLFAFGLRGLPGFLISLLYMFIFFSIGIFNFKYK